MKTITTNNRTLLFVEVPEDAMIEMSEDDTVLLYQLPPNLAPNDPMWQVPLPASDNNYRLIATTDTITEEQASELFGFKAITKDGKLYKYGLTASDGLPACASDKTGWVWSKFKSTVSEAVHTLLAEHSITGRHAIIEVL